MSKYNITEFIALVENLIKLCFFPRPTSIARLFLQSISPTLSLHTSSTRNPVSAKVRIKALSRMSRRSDVFE